MLHRKISQLLVLFFLIGCSSDDPTRYNTFIPLTSIQVTGFYDAMANQTVNQYRAVGDFSGSFTRDITDEVSWRIEKRKIASVSNDTGSQGLVTALAVGETSVTAMYGEISGKAPVIVTGASLAAIEITPQDAEIPVNAAQQFAAAGIFSDTSAQDITILATWESSDDNVAIIGSTGLATSLAKGITAISAAWQSVQASTTLLVSDATLTAIAIIPAPAKIAQETTLQFQAEGTYSDNTILDITDLVNWQSTDTGIAIVNAESGLASGVAPGKAEISASFDAGGNTISDSVELTVTDAVINSITVTPANSTIALDTNQQFTATGTFSDSSQQDITNLCSWTTSTSTVGIIDHTSDSRGLFISKAAGTTIITATYGVVSGTTLLTVE